MSEIDGEWGAGGAQKTTKTETEEYRNGAEETRDNRCKQRKEYPVQDIELLI